MKYYLYHPDANHFAGIMLQERDWHLISLRNQSVPIIDRWTPVRVDIFDDNPPTDGDFPSLSNYNQIPVMSGLAWDALGPLISYCCEALPIIHPSGMPFFMIHVMDIIGALDEKRSEVDRSRIDGRISDIWKYAFKMELIRRKHIFKLPIEQGSGLLVDEEFRKCVESNNLRGLLFKDLPMAAQPGSA